MKQKDIALIVVIGVISAALSIVISKTVFSSATKKNVKVEIVQPITSNFPDPDPAYFNNTAFDPTKQITIGQSVNTDPFKDSGNR